MHQLLLQRPEEALHHRVVPAVPLAAHAHLQAVGPEQLLVVIASILHAPVAVVQHRPDRRRCSRALPRARTTSSAAEVVGRRPADHPAAAQVQHRRQVQPALAGGDVGDVADPDPIDLAGLEPAIQRVLGDGVAVARVGGPDHEPPGGGGPHAGGASAWPRCSRSRRPPWPSGPGRLAASRRSRGSRGGSDGSARRSRTWWTARGLSGRPSQA